MTSNQFSIRLHEARKMMGLSMEKLAELTGGIITKQSISRFHHRRQRLRHHHHRV